MSLTDSHYAASTASCYAPVDTHAALAGRDSVTRTLALRHAGSRRVRIAYEWQGPADAPVVLVAGGISAHRHAASNDAYPEAGWWEPQVGAGKALDTTRLRVVAIDWLGSDGTLDAPIDSADQADAFAARARPARRRARVRLRRLFVRRDGRAAVRRAPWRAPWHVWSRSAARDRPHPYASAWRALQRNIVALGRNESASREALSLARQLAMLSYRTPEEFAERFDAPVQLQDGIARCAVGRLPRILRCALRRAHVADRLPAPVGIDRPARGGSARGHRAQRRRRRRRRPPGAASKHWKRSRPPSAPVAGSSVSARRTATTPSSTSPRASPRSLSPP